MSKAHQHLCYAMLDGCEQYVNPVHVEFLRSKGHVRYACFNCREQIAKQVKHCVVPGHKQAYMLVTNRDDLIGINNKGGQVR